MKTRLAIQLLLTMCIVFATALNNFGASVTIITHGFDYTGRIGGVQDWVDDMADAVAKRLDPTGNGASVSHYTLRVTGFNSYTLNKKSGPVPGEGANQADIVVKVDWATLSHQIGTADEVGRQVADALLAAATTDGTYNRALAELPLHFIGHSRGCYVNSAAIRALAARGVWVNHNTTLDPEDFGADGTFGNWSNIRFADNYYQQLAGLGQLTGFSVSGAFEVNLSSYANFLGAGPISPHERVHTYYHGSIALTADSVDGENILRSSWYGTSSSQQPKIGFYFGRSVSDEFSKTGFRDGLSQFFSGNGERTLAPSDPTFSQWPNIVLQNLLNKWELETGKEALLFYSFSDTDSSVSIALAADDDQNPYNNSPGNEVFTTTTANPASSGGVQPETKSFYWIPQSQHNNRYLYAKVTETGGLQRSRYHYLPQKFTVTATPPNPPPPPATVGNNLVRSEILRWDDRQGGDGDSVPEAGERVRLQINLRNNSSSLLDFVKATLTSYSPNAQVIHPDVVYGDLNPGRSSWSGSYFDLQLANFTALTPVIFRLRATYSKNNVDYYQDWDFSVTFYPNGALEPRFQVESVTIADNPTGGNGNGLLESGESSDFFIRLRNTGNAPATQVRAKVVNVSLAEVDTTEVEYPDIAGGGGAQNPKPGDEFVVRRIPKNFAGILKGDIVVTYSQSNQEYVIKDYPLLDVKTARWVSLSRNSYNFGVSPTTTNVVVPLTIENIGTETLTVSAITTSQGDTTWTGESLPWAIPVGDSKTINVTIATASLSGQITRELTVTSNGRVRTPGTDDKLVISGLVSDTLQTVTISSPSYMDSPDISGTVIVWVDGRNGNQDIYGMDLVTGDVFPVCTNAGPQTTPFISGNIIAWRDRRNSTLGDIYFYNLVTKQEFTVSTDAAEEWVVGVDGQRIAFVRRFYTFPGGESTGNSSAFNLLLYDTGTGQTTLVTSFSHSGFNPMSIVDRGNCDFDGGLLAWKEQDLTWNGSSAWILGNSRIRKIKIGTDSTPQTIPTGGFSDGPAVGGGKLVFTQRDASDFNRDKVWIWEAGTTRKVTTTAGIDVGNVLSMNSSYTAYSKHSATGLFGWDLAQGGNGEFQILDVETRTVRFDGAGMVALRNAAETLAVVFLGQPDLVVATNDITFSASFPTVGEPVAISVTVNNGSRVAATNDIIVQIYDGNPDAGGVQIGSSRVVAGGMAAQSRVTVVFQSVVLPNSGVRSIYARVLRSAEENPANNKAFTPLTVLAVVPTVSLDVVDRFAFETGSKPGVVAVHRSSGTNAPLAVNYSISGTAVNGVDYASLSGSVSIPAGAFSANILITAIDDVVVESAETVTLTLATNVAYNIGASASATIGIADNDGVPRQPRFESPLVSTGQPFQFALTLDRGRIYIVDVTTNLVNWLPVFTNTSPDEVFLFVDQQAVNHPRRFYRIRHP